MIGLRVLSIAALAAGVLAMVRSGSDTATWDPLAHFLIAAAAIVLLSHLMGAALRPLHQPQVVGELVAGLLLGPSVLGATLPGVSHWLFDAATVSSLSTAAQLGLVMFMFLLGCESHGGISQTRVRPVLVVATLAMLLPFAGGAGLALGFSDLTGSTDGHTGYVIFLGLAISITALPVLARIIDGLDLATTPAGQLALRTAATGDAFAWMALSVLLATLAGSGLTGVGQRLGAAIALVLVAVLCVRPALRAVLGRDGSGGARHLLLGLLLASALGGAGVAEAIGLHPAIGAFIFGAVVPRASPALARATFGLQAFAVAVLLPIFFASIGLQVSIGLLGRSPRTWGLFGGVVAIAFVTKLVGGFLGARAVGLGSRDSARVGTLMNCRGVTELVIASIGFQHHLINGLGFTMLVLVALITTAATGPLLRVLDRHPAGRGRPVPAGRPSSRGQPRPVIGDGADSGLGGGAARPARAGSR